MIKVGDKIKVVSFRPYGRIYSQATMDRNLIGKVGMVIDYCSETLQGSYACRVKFNKKSLNYSGSFRILREVYLEKIDGLEDFEGLIPM